MKKVASGALVTLQLCLKLTKAKCICNSHTDLVAMVFNLQE